MFPLRENAGGILARQGHTEAGVALCRLAGLREVAVISELVSEDSEVEGVAERKGSGMMRRDECLTFARQWGLKISTIEALLEFVQREGKVKEMGMGLPNGKVV